MSRPLPRRLLAKSPPRGVSIDDAPRACLLVEHLRDVMAVAEAVVEVSGETLLRNVDLEPALWRPRLARSLRLAAGIHDLGKANDRFQAMLARDQDHGRQPVRHEAISALMALHPKLLGPQLVPDPAGADLEVVASMLAVVGHHLKFCEARDRERAGISDPTARGKIRLLCTHPDFAAALGLLELRPPPGNDLECERERLLDLLDDALEALWSAHRASFGYGRRDLGPFDVPWGRFLALLKALLMACDGAGSALPRSGERPEAWARAALGVTLATGELEAIVSARLDGHALRPFQEAIAAAPTRVVVAEAGCGSGKTLAAYAWARTRATGRKLCFAYPTTGTATEGFGDYVLDRGVPAELVHGRAAVDLEALLDNGTDADDDAVDDALIRVRGLEHWTSAIAVSTADAVLGLMQNHRRGLYGSAAIAGSAFVFDEIHAYDPRMWRTLLDFVRWQRGAPVLLMTATLPAHRREALRALLGEEVSFVEGPAELEALPRYLLEHRASPDGLVDEVAAAVREGRRVLFVCNTVARAMAYASALAAALEATPGEAPVLVYHARFRYEDRVARHRELVEAFAADGGGGAGVVGITTQVAEMSLDLDADLLVTELAPVHALIQRLGRLNRRATPERCEARRCVVLDVGDEALPYEAAELDRARRWLASLPQGALSQATLATTSVAEAGDDARSEPCTLAAPPLQAAAGQLREAGVTASFLLACDERAARRDANYAIRSTLPMTLPRAWPFRDWASVGMARVVPRDAIHYDPRLGAFWLRPGHDPQGDAP